MKAFDIDIENEVILILRGVSGARADELIRRGVPLAALDRLAKYGIDVARLGIIKPRTLSHRRSRSETLSPEEGDRLYRAGKIILLAEEKFLVARKKPPNGYRKAGKRWASSAPWKPSQRRQATLRLRSSLSDCATGFPLD